MSRRRKRGGDGLPIEKLINIYGNKCHICELDLDDTITRDHKIPRALGGTHHYSNLFLAHFSCNNARGIVSMETLEQIKAEIRPKAKHEKDFRRLLLSRLRRYKDDERTLYEGYETAPS